MTLVKAIRLWMVFSKLWNHPVDMNVFKLSHTVVSTMVPTITSNLQSNKFYMNTINVQNMQQLVRNVVIEQVFPKPSRSNNFSIQAPQNVVQDDLFWGMKSRYILEIGVVRSKQSTMLLPLQAILQGIFNFILTSQNTLTLFFAWTCKWRQSILLQCMSSEESCDKDAQPSVILS